MTTKITKPLLADDSVGTDQIEDAAVTPDKLATDSVITDKIADDQVTQPKIGPAAVGPTELADESVTGPKYADASIPTAAYIDESIPTTALANQSVTEEKLGAQSVTTPKLGLQSVDTVNYVASSINSTALQNSSVITDKIDDNAVTLGKFQQSAEGTLITYDDQSAAIVLPAGAEGSILSIQNSRPAWTGSTLPTGTIIDYFGTAAPDGWIVIDGSTIGSAGSTADYASDTMEGIYYHLWNNFANSIIAVSGGRGASAGDDWAADKTITLPNFIGRTTVMADMNTETPSGIITSATFTNGVSQIGGTGGTETIALAAGNIPDHKHYAFRTATTTNPVWSQPAITPTSTINDQVSKWDGNISSEDHHQHSYRMYYNNSYIAPTTGMSSSPVDASGDAISTGTAVNKMQPSVLVLKIMKI